MPPEASHQRDLRLLVPLVRRSNDAPERLPPEFDVAAANALFEEPLAPGLRILYAFDLDDRFEYLQARQLSELDLRPNEVLDLAVTNLGARLPPIVEHKGQHVSMLTAGANLVSSLMLLPALCDELEEEVDGRLVVAVPARDLFLFTGHNSSDGIVKLEQLINDCWQGGSKLVSRSLFTRVGSQWGLFPSPTSLQ